MHNCYLGHNVEFPYQLVSVLSFCIWILLVGWNLKVEDVEILELML